MLLGQLEATLNRNLAASSVARDLCARLNGKSLRVRLTGLAMEFKIDSYGDRLALTRDASDAAADATLSGSLLGLMNLLGAQPEAAVRGGSVHIEGDAEVAQAFRDLLKQARPEFEEELSRYVGDVAAHQAGNFIRGTMQFGKRAADTLAQNLGEYLQEEGRDAAHRIELEEFHAAVDTLRNDVERADAKLALLEQQVAQQKRG